MCGICGFTWRDEDLARRMAGRMAHRGPDQHGTWCDEGISLGHRRLSIIDLSDRGRQPMANEDGMVRVVCNGEIYNFQELRAELEARGHRFAGRSDTEVVVHGYEEYGPGVLEKLRGMFAFAVWDGRAGTLLAARDRIGIKPLYYVQRDGQLLFASEIKALLEWPGLGRELDRQALYDYLGYEFVPAPDTMFREVKKLPAGHCVLFRDGRAEVRAWWDLSFAAGPPPPLEEAVERARLLLEETVAGHLVSDVPLGVFLSGGLDSSAIVAMMRRRVTGRLRTFTVGYPDETFSELDYARAVAERFQTDHQVLMIEDLKPEHIEQAVWHLDEPMTDLSAVPLFLVCRQAREHVTVCLSGEGGDESLAGYDRFKASRLDRVWRRLPAFARRRVGRVVRGLADRPEKKGFVNMLKRFIEGAELPAEGGHLRWQYFGDPRRDALLFQPRFLDGLDRGPFRHLRPFLERCAGADRINREVCLDLRFMMADSVLMKVDKMSMAHALEIRVPMLDHVFVEYLASLPGRWKLRGLTTKYVFRKALAGILPDRIVRRGKQGYSLPVKHLLRGRLKDYMIELLEESPLVRQNLNLDWVRRLVREHLEMRHNHNHVLWALMNAAIWQRHFKVRT